MQVTGKEAGLLKPSSSEIIAAYLPQCSAPFFHSLAGVCFAMQCNAMQCTILLLLGRGLLYCPAISPLLDLAGQNPWTGWPADFAVATAKKSEGGSNLLPSPLLLVAVLLPSSQHIQCSAGYFLLRYCSVFSFRKIQCRVSLWRLQCILFQDNAVQWACSHPSFDPILWLGGLRFSRTWLSANNLSGNLQ